MTMEYVLPISIFLLVLSPLYIPVGVTIVHSIRNWRPRVPLVRLAPARRRRRIELATELS
jgi:hypothetical protein